MTEETETAVLAGGFAWIMQQLLRQPDGVVATRTGFMGGTNDNPSEEDSGGHAEVVEVVFDPTRLSYRGLLEVFFQVHRPHLDERVVGSLASGAAITLRRERQDMIDRSEAADRRLPTLAKDPTEKAESAEPTEPIDSTDPIEPMDRIEPLDPMLRTESVDRIESRDPLDTKRL